MSLQSATGNDSLTLIASTGPRVIADFAPGDYITAEFPEKMANLKVGKDGNAIFAENRMGDMGRLTVRLNRGSSDDLWFGSLLNSQITSFADFIALSGTYTKRTSDLAGNTSAQDYILQGGVFEAKPGMKSNAEGDTEQAVVIYVMIFALVKPKQT